MATATLQETLHPMQTPTRNLLLLLILLLHKAVRNPEHRPNPHGSERTPDLPMQLAQQTQVLQKEAGRRREKKQEKRKRNGKKQRICGRSGRTMRGKEYGRGKGTPGRGNSEKPGREGRKRLKKELEHHHRHRRRQIHESRNLQGQHHRLRGINNRLQRQQLMTILTHTDHTTNLNDLSPRPLLHHQFTPNLPTPLLNQRVVRHLHLHTAAPTEVKTLIRFFLKPSTPSTTPSQSFPLHN